VDPSGDPRREYDLQIVIFLKERLGDLPGLAPDGNEADVAIGERLAGAEVVAVLAQPAHA
jgi:hypothetical protein